MPFTAYLAALQASQPQKAKPEPAPAHVNGRPLASHASGASPASPLDALPAGTRRRDEPA